MSTLSALRKGVGWGGASLIIATAVQLIYMAAMARLLDPGDFGLLAIAGIVLRSVGYFAQLGVTPAVIQKPQLDASDVGGAIAVSVGAATACFALVALASPLFSAFFGQADLRSVIAVLAFNFVLVGMSAVPVGLLRRSLNFKRVAMIDSVAYIVGYCALGLGLAVMGAGVWALVGAILGQSLVTLTLSFASTKDSIAWRHSAADRRFFVRFGRKYSVTGFLEFLTSNLDALVIGKLMGASPAGIYNRASLLANLPVQQPVNVLTNSLYPILSSISSDKAKISYGLQLSLIVVGGFSVMVSLAISLAAPEIVSVLLGSKWTEVIPVLQVLSMSVAPLFINHVIGITLDSVAELRVRLAVQGTSVLTLGALLYGGYRYGLTGVALAMVVNECLRCTMMLLAATIKLRMARADLGRCLASIAAMGLICSLAFGAMRASWAGQVSPMVGLALDVPAGLMAIAVAVAASSLIFRRLESVRVFAARGPGWIRRFLRLEP